MARRASLALVLVGLGLLLAPWVVATQPFAAPDEASHYLRALNIAQGHLLGPRVRYPPVAGLTPSELAFVQHDTRGVSVPAGLSPGDVSCLSGRADVAGRCVEPTPTGDYYPPAYLLPALVLKLAHHADTALWWSRFLDAGLCLGFIILAAVLLWGGTAWSLLGLLGAVSPMVLFVSSILNPSGLDTAASLAAAAAAIRISRGPPLARPWMWGALVLSGAVTILAFQAGPAFLLADLAVAVALTDRGALRALRGGAERRALLLSALGLLAAFVLWFVYARVSDASHSHLGFTPVLHSLRIGLQQLGFVLRDAVGNFGSLTVALPVAARIVWWGFVASLVGAALWLSAWRERILMLAVVLVGLGFPVLSYAWIYRYSGFGMQGRQVLPVLMLIPLTAGELVYRQLGTFSARATGWLLAAALALVAVFQGYAWFYAARIAAGAPGTLRFYAHATWRPPLGWGPWIAVAGAGTLALLAAALAALRGSRLRTAPSG